MEKEIWKDIVGYENLYQVSNLGNIKSLSKKLKNKHGFRITKEITIAKTNNGTGYLICSLSNKGRKNFLVHRLVAIHFVKGRSKSRNFINHKDGNKKNNDHKNLEWCTVMENIQHSIKTKLVDQKGSKHHNSILTEKDVVDIRKMYQNTDMGYNKISKIYGVSWGTIRNVIKGRTWTHI